MSAMPGTAWVRPSMNMIIEFYNSADTATDDGPRGLVPGEVCYRRTRRAWRGARLERSTAIRRADETAEGAQAPCVRATTACVYVGLSR